MYFDASEHIARNTNHPRSQIEKIDEFLARPRVKRFEIDQLKEKARLGLTDDVAPILDEYVRAKVLKKPENVYLCPQHVIRLEKINRNEGQCIDCEKRYAFEDCPSKLIYERIQDPDRLSETPSEKQRIRDQPNNKTKWWTKPSSVLTIIGLVIAGCGLLFTIIQVILIILPSTEPNHQMGNNQPTEQITLPPPTTETVPTIATELPSTDTVPTVGKELSVESTVEVIAEVTAELTPDLEVTEELSQE